MNRLVFTGTLLFLMLWQPLPMARVQASLSERDARQGSSRSPISLWHQRLKVQQRAVTRLVVRHAIKTNPTGGAIVVRREVQGSWALATIVRQFSPTEVRYLLRRQKMGWKILAFGKDLGNAGQKYGVPMHLRRNWGLG